MAAINLELNVKPAFIRMEEIGKIDGYSLGQAIMKTIGSNLDTVQPVRNLWRIYTTSQSKKIELVSKGLTLDGKWIKIYDSNPYITSVIDSIGNEVSLVRVLIKDLLKSVANEQVQEMFETKFKVKVIGGVKKAFYRNPANELTGLGNGDRYCFVHPNDLLIPLPREAYCGIHKIRIFHRDQFDSKKECWKCFSPDHFGSQCKKPKHCRICKCPGHEPGSPDCDFFEEVQGILAFGGWQDPFSNHYPCKFVWNHIEVKSSEHAFFYMGTQS